MATDGSTFSYQGGNPSDANLTYALNQLAGTAGLPQGRALAAAAARMNGAARGFLGSSSKTAGETVAGVFNPSGLSVTVTVAASRRIKVSAHVDVQTSAAAYTEVRIVEGSTVLQLARASSYASGAPSTVTPYIVLTPSAGSHTYFVQDIPAAGQAQVNASSTNPATILVEDIGAA